MGTKINDGDSGLSVRTELNELIPEALAVFAPALITLDDKESYFSAYAQVGALVISDPVNNYGLGAAFTVTITTDGDTITFPAAWKEIRNDYAADVADYLLTVGYDGVNWIYSLILLP